MDRVGMVLDLVAEFVMGRVCQGPSLSWAEFVMGRDVPESYSKIFSSETAWPIKVKFYRKHLYEGGTNVIINKPGHMTKMATMPIIAGTAEPIATKLDM